MGYVVYVTGKDGQGFTQRVGFYDNLEEINVHIGMFADDVVLTIEKELDTSPKPTDSTVTLTNTPTPIPDIKLK